MGCVVIEIFPERYFDDINFGKNNPAIVVPSEDQSSIITLNTNAVLAFEEIEIKTKPPHTTEGPSDIVEGVRIKTTWGQHLVVFNDVPLNFRKAMEAACSHQKISDITTTNSRYWRQFKRDI